MAGAEEKLADIVRHVIAVFEPKEIKRILSSNYKKYDRLMEHTEFFDFLGHGLITQVRKRREERGEGEGG